jgi:outer membrane protein assembly factor BamA
MQDRHRTSRRIAALWLLLGACLAPTAASAAAPPTAKKPLVRIAQIFVMGNERTRQDVILRQVPLYPGQVLSYPDLRAAERNLRRLNLFESSPDGSVRPTITVVDNPTDPEDPFKDVLISVQEANTGSLMFGVGVNSSGGPTGSILIEERNFDPLRWPTSLDDLLSGNAFRGAGMTFRLELLPADLTARVSLDPAGVRLPFPLWLLPATRWVGCLLVR